jgi:hypothetical protein
VKLPDHAGQFGGRVRRVFLAKIGQRRLDRSPLIDRSTDYAVHSVNCSTTAQPKIYPLAVTEWLIGGALDRRSFKPRREPIEGIGKRQ